MQICKFYAKIHFICLFVNSSLVSRLKTDWYLGPVDYFGGYLDNLKLINQLIIFFIVIYTEHTYI